MVPGTAVWRGRRGEGGRGVGREWASLLRRERESTGLSPARATRPNPWVPCATSSRAPGEGADGATGATGRRAPVPGREAAGGGERTSGITPAGSRRPPSPRPNLGARGGAPPSPPVRSPSRGLANLRGPAPHTRRHCRPRRGRASVTRTGSGRGGSGAEGLGVRREPPRRERARSLRSPSRVSRRCLPPGADPELSPDGPVDGAPGSRPCLAWVAASLGPLPAVRGPPRGMQSFSTGSQRDAHDAPAGAPVSAALALGNDPSAGSPTETLLRLLLPLDSPV